VSIFELDGVGPRFTDPAQVYVAPGAQIIGNVVLGTDASVWFNAVVRADNDQITIGDRANVQDGAIVHADPGMPAVIGNDVTIGHHAIVHGANVGEGSLIGMGAVLLNRSRIGASCLVGANALVTEGKEFPDGSLIMGSPAKLVRALAPEEIAGLRESAATYVANGRRFAAGLRPVARAESDPDSASTNSDTVRCA
jgi:carbonic anhydrase/acetyltransferase-like protein (isoleucine patch superfamily)